MKPFEDIDMDMLLPQQPPFRFVDSLESYTEEDTVVHLTVGSGHMLMGRNSVLPGFWNTWPRPAPPVPVTACGSS